MDNAALDKKATTAMVLGIVAMVAWLLPIVGLPISILAIVKGVGGRESPTHAGRATAGLVLGIVATVLTVLNGIAGMLIAFS